MASADVAKWRFETVTEDEDGSRLDRFLRRLIPGLGQGQIEKMLRNGLIRIDGAKAKSASRIAMGQTIRLPLSIDALASSKLAASVATTKTLAAPTIGNTPLQKTFDDMVIGEGKGWIALNKPSGLAVQGALAQNSMLTECWRRWRRVVANACGWCTGSTRIRQVFCCWPRIWVRRAA